MVMECLRWCSDFMNEICKVSHFFMRGEEIVDLEPKSDIQTSGTVGATLDLTSDDSESDRETQFKSPGINRFVVTLICSVLLWYCEFVFTAKATLQATQRHCVIEAPSYVLFTFLLWFAMGSSLGLHCVFSRSSLFQFVLFIFYVCFKLLLL